MNTTPKNILKEAWEEFNNTPPNPTNMLDINSNQCEYHLDNTQDVADSNTLFCGKPCLKNFSYCWYHYEITHERKNNT